jgi:hypothetical protein
MKTFYEVQQSPGQYQFNALNSFRNIAAGSYYLSIQQNGKKINIRFIKY